MISKTSGTAGIAYWINMHFDLKGDKMIDKRDILVASIKEWVDNEYEQGRQSSISNSELYDKVEEFAPGRFDKVK